MAFGLGILSPSDVFSLAMVCTDIFDVLIGTPFDSDQHRALAGMVLCTEWDLRRAAWLAWSRGIDDLDVCGNQVLLAAVEQGHFNAVQTLLDDPRIDPAFDDNAVIKRAAAYRKPTMMRQKVNFFNARIIYGFSQEVVDQGHIDVMNLLLRDSRIDPSANNNEAFLDAVTFGHVAMVELLLKDPRVDPSDQDNTAISRAALRRYLDIVQMLMDDPRVDPSARCNAALNKAVSTKNHDMIALLLTDPRVNIDALVPGMVWFGKVEKMAWLLENTSANPAYNHNEAICIAAKEGNAEMVAYLLADPRVDPSDDDCAALKGAAYRGTLDVVKLLFADPRIDIAIWSRLTIHLATCGKKHDIVEFVRAHST